MRVKVSKDSTQVPAIAAMATPISYSWPPFAAALFCVRPVAAEDEDETLSVGADGRPPADDDEDEDELAGSDEPSRLVSSSCSLVAERNT